MSTIINNDFFPHGLALGKNFCNRIQEQKNLIENIKNTSPTLVISPRRYGKTSLVLNVIHRLKLPFSHIDLYADLNESEVQNTILGGVGDILYSIESAPKRAFKAIADFFSDLNVSFRLSGTHINVEFSRSKKTPAKIILSVLKKLDETLQRKNKKAILFFDEFQRIAQISESAAIEGAIRHVAQKSKHIVFVFSGSNRHLLSSMFNDRTKPFYKLCDCIFLERISAKHYTLFIKSMARKKFSKKIDDDAIQAILDKSERHPYYLNVLCHKLWLKKKIPSKEDVLHAWHRYAMEEKANVLSEIELLSNNQAKMLIAIAKYGTENPPMSKEFIALTKFSLSSASQAVKSLEKMDYLYTDNKGKYCILDPLIQYIFTEL